MSMDIASSAFHGKARHERVLIVSEPPTTYEPPQTFHKLHNVLNSPSICISIPRRRSALGLYNALSIVHERPRICLQPDHATSIYSTASTTDSTKVLATAVEQLTAAATSI